MESQRKLVPILCEGIDVVKMIFFKKLKIYLVEKYPHREAGYAGKLAGTIINRLFGTSNMERGFTAFQEDNAPIIEDELSRLAVAFPEMRIPLTDALRTQFLCDQQEGIDSSSILTQAQTLGILMVDRDIPMPAQFIHLVRELGSKLDLLRTDLR